MKPETLNELPIWVIYRHPADAPNSFVLRRWVMRDGRSYADARGFMFPTLEAARAAVPSDKFRIPHQPGEPSVIEETWI